MAKFMRNYLITWYDVDKNEKILIGDTNWQAKEGWVYPNLLTINLDVNRNTFASANECHLQILNLNKSNRQRMFHDRYRPDQIIFLEIMAGYGQNLSLIFRGKVLQSYSYMQGNDMVTDIQALDIGFMEYVKDGRTVNYSSMTLEAGTTKREAIERIQADMESGTQLGAIGKIGDVAYQTPVSFLGNSIYLLDTLTGGHVFVDLGKINILSDKEAIDVGQIPVINADTGLLGTPMRREAQLEVDVLFEPSIIVGQVVKLDTITGVNEYNGVFKVIGIHHTGTISAASCGVLKTRLNLWYGVLLPQTDNTYVVSEEQFSLVKGADVVPYDGETPKDCIDVYNYIQRVGEVPDWYIPNTTIKWREVIKEGKPSLEIITNLARVCQTAQKIANKVTYSTPRIKVSSGYRTPAKNKSVKGSSTSLHLTGRAIDITAVGGISNLRNIYAIFNPYSEVRELLLESGCVHVGIDKVKFTRGYWDKKTNTVRDL